MAFDPGDAGDRVERQHRQHGDRRGQQQAEGAYLGRLIDVELHGDPEQQDEEGADAGEHAQPCIAADDQDHENRRGCDDRRYRQAARYRQLVERGHAQACDVHGENCRPLAMAPYGRVKVKVAVTSISAPAPNRMLRSSAT